MTRTPCGSIQFANEGKWTEDNLIPSKVIAAAQTSNDPDNENPSNDDPSNQSPGHVCS